MSLERTSEEHLPDVVAERMSHWELTARHIVEFGEDALVEGTVSEQSVAVLLLAREIRRMRQLNADQEWLTRDARECARALFPRLDDGQQRAIVDDATWEWEWLLHSDLAPHPPFPPSTRRRWARGGGTERDGT